MSVTISNAIKEVDDDSQRAIPLPAVSGPILAKIIDWANHHRDDPPPPYEEDFKTAKTADDIGEWDQEFVKVDQATLFDMIMAANYLDIKPLLDMLCKTVANMIKGKNVEEIREKFGIKNDFTPEEEEEVRRENEWCEER
eukprot:TRINITY_DN65783_c0_g1_i1.p1 TRINITY_DN65783_c0_g1~~TRINITY_DN65783_c0_g1_i1.p1  ORF type:complete len:150 (-),score=26.04 TRINITY_DN65783_c0_g1_i1:159-578(-)